MQRLKFYLDWLSKIRTPQWDNERSRAEQLFEIGDWMTLLDSSMTRVSSKADLGH